MRWVKNIVRELYGLFVDDGSFAVAVLIWIALISLVWHRWRMVVPAGVVLFLGLAFILIESVIRFSRRSSG